ncbi:hypothetical protein H8959_013878 [Pygathrix nigripes]
MGLSCSTGQPTELGTNITLILQMRPQQDSINLESNPKKNHQKKGICRTKTANIQNLDGVPSQMSTGTQPKTKVLSDKRPKERAEASSMRQEDVSSEAGQTLKATGSPTERFREITVPCREESPVMTW